MKRYNCLWVFALMLVTGTSWAYGGGSAVQKPVPNPNLPILFQLKMPKLQRAQALLSQRLQTHTRVPSRLP